MHTSDFIVISLLTIAILLNYLIPLYVIPAVNMLNWIIGTTLILLAYLVIYLTKVEFKKTTRKLHGVTV
jgi:multisubunit Na+/H+ antiporter MnhC subunit